MRQTRKTKKNKSLEAVNIQAYADNSIEKNIDYIKYIKRLV